MNKVVMIPARPEVRTPILRFPNADLYHYCLHYKTIDYQEPGETYQQLLILSEEKPRVGDIGFLDWEGKNQVEDMRYGRVLEIDKDSITLFNQYRENKSNCNLKFYPSAEWWKVIASTDEKLGLPMPPQDFLQNYCANPEANMRPQIKVNVDGSIDFSQYFNVFCTTTIEEGNSKMYAHWSEGLTMYITKGGIHLTLNSEEVQKLVQSLPKTIGGTY